MPGGLCRPDLAPGDTGLSGARSPAPAWWADLRRTGRLLVLRGDHPAGPRHEEPETASPEPEGHGLELFLSVDDEGRVTAYNGHVDLGTGIGTALAQIVAEELDVAFDAVTMVLGHTGATPNQGATIASETIQVTAMPLRRAAAQARHSLVALAAEAMGVPAAELTVDEGTVRRGGGNAALTYGDLLRGRRIHLRLDDAAPVKAAAGYRLVGQPVPRVDIPDKATGAFTYVHDVRVPGMLHGRVVRPPYAGFDHGSFVGRSLIGVDEASVAGMPGLVTVVVVGDFVGVVAEREEQAALAAETLVTRWRGWNPAPDLDTPGTAIRANPSTPRVLLDRGEVDAALAGAATPMRRTYSWPYQLHGSIGPSCSVADVRSDGITLWSGTQNPLMLRADLARLTGMSEARISIVRHDAAGCYGRNCADDVGADAVLLSRAVGRPVRVQLTREQEHLWEPKGTAQLMDVAGGLTSAGEPAAYDFQTRYPSNGAPTLALLLTGVVAPVAQVFEMGDRTAIPPYAYDNARVTVHDMPPIARASWFRGVSALPNSFAHESFVDELATAAGVDPVEYRLRHLQDERASDLVRAVADRAGWEPHTVPQTMAPDGDWLRGRGFAYAVYVHGKFPGTAAAWSAWVAEVAVNRASGEVAVERIVVGQDSGLIINPAGVEHQIHGNVVQSTSRVLHEQVPFEAGLPAARDWGSYPILTFAQLPAIEVVTLDRPEEPPLGVGESASVPSAAAIANAIFDATGVRFREPPFTAERVRAGLNPLAAPTAEPLPAVRPSRAWQGWKRSRPRLSSAWVSACAATVGAFAAIVLPLRTAIPQIPRPDPSVYSAATIARGRLALAAGNCAVCHAGPDGRGLAGGRPIHTPFGTVIASNISPHPAAGIGGWSYPAFERAMREGVSRDGRNLYPAHPYTSFALVPDADLQALYAALMAAPAEAHVPPPTRLAAPFGERRLMRLWNALFLRGGPPVPDPARSDSWNRGRELVEGLGHCSACHSPRNALGAERGGALHLAGGTVDGWDAPSLSGSGGAPVPWTADAFYAFLSTGHDPHHGVAAGPMAAVVRELALLPDADRRAMADYLSSLQVAPAEPAPARAAALEARAAAEPLSASSLGRQIYRGACAQCHEPDGPTLFGVRPSLALNTGIHADRPDNLIRVVLEGLMEPAHAELGTMPAFGRVFSDRQVAELLRYIRARFAADAPPWADLEGAIARVRAASDAPRDPTIIQTR